MTPQYAGLRALHDDNRERGLSVLGFPCNQFGAQEPGSNPEILEFATSKYGVTFPMFAKIEVNGPGASPLYGYLQQGAREGDGTTDIKWNFTKFLVDRAGHVIKRYAPAVTPAQIGAELDLDS